MNTIALCAVRDAMEPPGKGPTNPQWAWRSHPLAELHKHLSHDKSYLLHTF